VKYHWLKKDGLPEIAHKIVEDLNGILMWDMMRKMQVVVIEDKMH
jgi:hypothetical protein